MPRDNEISREPGQSGDREIVEVSALALEMIAAEYNHDPQLFSEHTIAHLNSIQPVLSRYCEDFILFSARDKQEVMNIASVLAVTYRAIETQLQTEAFIEGDVDQIRHLPLVTEAATSDINMVASADAGRQFGRAAAIRLATEQPLLARLLYANINAIARDLREKSTMRAGMAVLYSMLRAQAEIEYNK